VTGEIAILHRDEHVVAVSKPSGIHVHRSPLSPDRDVLLARVRDRVGMPVHAVHRLDRATSGIVLFALSPESTRAFQEALRADRAEKAYWALVRGTPPESFRSDRPLTRRSDGVIQPASTEFRRLAGARGFSLVEARLRTGRRHQVRRHLDHLGHQVVGDTSYGKGRINRWLRAEYGLPRLFLHAARVSLLHPFTGVEIEIADPLPPDLAEFLARFAPELAGALAASR